MMFSAIHTHPALECPRMSSQGKATIRRVFSNENMKRFGIKLVGAYLSCPKNTGEDHRGFFIVDADSAATVTRFFSPLPVDIRQVTPLSEIMKNL
ncbi:MAG: hypothetical protein WED04_09935 [Promethearchaeati archaeon SRVP18_Atabeyarchaeia-1]